MANLTFKGQPVSTNAALPAVGEVAKDFVLVDGSLAEKRLADFAGKTRILTVNPSYDTGVCMATARGFNQRAASVPGAVVLLVSADLPFAQKRFCTAEGLDGVVALSSFRGSFGDDYGLRMVDGPLRGLLARAVIVIGPDDVVKYVQLVPEVVQEPDYEAALAAAR